MKAFKLIGVSAAAALLLTSCLSGGSNTSNRTTFAVGGTSDKAKTILNTPVGPIYSAALASKVVDGACYSVNFEIDLDNPENADAAVNGYLTATVGALEEIIKGQSVFYNVPDTAKLLKDEIVLLNAGFMEGMGAYVDGFLFMGEVYNGLKDQKNVWTLYWDPSKEPVVIDGRPTYSLFLRSAKVTDGTGSTSTSMTEIRAYNIESVLRTVNNTEVAKGTKEFNLKINYLNNINEKDSTNLTWKSFVAPFAAVKDGI